MAKVLSKIKIGDVIYNLKDAVAQADIVTINAAIAALGDASKKGVATIVAEDGTDLPTAGAVYDAIQNAVKNIAGAMHYRGSFDATSEVTDPVAGDVILVGTKEYIYGGDPAGWQELGDEGVYLTITTAANTYVPLTRTIAGIDLRDDITKDELVTALDIASSAGLGAMAYVDKAGATVTDYATGLTMNAYTPTGTVAVTLTDTATDITSTGDFTPAGAVALAKDNENGVAISGTVSAPTITVTPTNGDVVTGIDTAGTLPSYTETTAKYATEGITASIDADDAEMLVFGTAATSDAVASASFTAGAMPTYTTGKALTGVAATATAPTFTGDKYAATFTGTKGTVSVDGSYDKASVNTATFTGTAATLTGSLTTGSKTIEVTPVEAENA